MSKTLRRELMLFGIDVIVVGPGAIRTPIWGKADLAGYANTPYKAALDRAYEYMQQFAAEGRSFRSRSGTGYSRDCFPSAGSTR